MQFSLQCTNPGQKDGIDALSLNASVGLPVQTADLTSEMQKASPDRIAYKVVQLTIKRMYRKGKAKNSILRKRKLELQGLSMLSIERCSSRAELIFVTPRTFFLSLKTSLKTRKTGAKRDICTH
jgi:hypothetical protein